VPPRVIVHTSVSAERIFHCVACRTSTPALVVGIGQGEEVGAFATDEVMDGARRDAEADAEADVELALSLARCPSCGHRSAAAQRRFWAVQASAVALATVLPWSGVGIEYGLQGTTSGASILGPLGVVVGLAVAARAWATWSTVRQRVHFTRTLRETGG